jgi:hypothetical protein
MIIKRLARRVLRKCGIALPYADVICAEHVQSIGIDVSWKAKATLQQKLVFLDVPDSGDLRDTCQVSPETTFENFIIQSPDAVETGRRRLGRGAIVVDWEPRSRITPYALYEHQHTWFPVGSHEQLALSTEFHCEMRTGLFLFEMVTPQSFEAAVIFERPRWTLLNTEKRLARYALKQLDAGAERASILDNGQRVEWKILGPKIGKRYICVAFHLHGVLLWKERLEKATFAGRMRQLFGRGRVVPG